MTALRRLADACQRYLEADARALDAELDRARYTLAGLVAKAPLVEARHSEGCEECGGRGEVYRPDDDIYAACFSCHEQMAGREVPPLSPPTPSPGPLVGARVDACAAVEPGTGHRCFGDSIRCPSGVHSCSGLDERGGTCGAPALWRTPPHPEARFDLSGRPLVAPGGRLKVNVSDPETAATLEAARESERVVASWPAWKRGEDYPPPANPPGPGGGQGGGLDALVAKLDGVTLQVNTGKLAAMQRDCLGEMVRILWVRWAEQQPNPKPSWLVPYDQLSEPDKEADRQIGEGIWALATRSALPPPCAKPGHQGVGCAGCAADVRLAMVKTAGDLRFERDKRAGELADLIVALRTALGLGDGASAEECLGEARAVREALTNGQATVQHWQDTARSAEDALAYQRDALQAAVDSENALRTTLSTLAAGLAALAPFVSLPEARAKLDALATTARAALDGGREGGEGPL